MNPPTLEHLAAHLIAGQLTIADFVGQVQRAGIADVGPAQVDLDRHRRCGFPEVVFSQGKTVEAIAKIFRKSETGTQLVSALERLGAAFAAQGM